MSPSKPCSAFVNKTTIGNVEFTLTPEDDQGTISLSNANQSECIAELKNFTGTFRLKELVQTTGWFYKKQVVIDLLSPTPEKKTEKFGNLGRKARDSVGDDSVNIPSVASSPTIGSPMMMGTPTPKAVTTMVANSNFSPQGSFLTSTTVTTVSHGISPNPEFGESPFAASDEKRRQSGRSHYDSEEEEGLCDAFKETQDEDFDWEALVKVEKENFIDNTIIEEDE